MNLEGIQVCSLIWSGLHGVSESSSILRKKRHPPATQRCFNCCLEPRILPFGTNAVARKVHFRSNCVSILSSLLVHNGSGCSPQPTFAAFVTTCKRQSAVGFMACCSSLLVFAPPFSFCRFEPARFPFFLLFLLDIASDLTWFPFLSAFASRLLGRTSPFSRRWRRQMRMTRSPLISRWAKWRWASEREEIKEKREQRTEKKEWSHEARKELRVLWMKASERQDLTTASWTLWNVHMILIQQCSEHRKQDNQASIVNEVEPKTSWWQADKNTECKAKEST